MASNLDNALQETLKRDSFTFRGIYAVSFAVFLAVAIVVQLLPLQWRTWFPGAEGGQTLVGDVRSAVYTFMSYLT
jgi:light-harvesting complex 1 beta chain